MTYSEHLEENHPTLSINDVEKILKKHGLNTEQNWIDLDEELGIKELYTANEILGFLGY
mgnify:CR=1 FL=1